MAIDGIINPGLIDQAVNDTKDPNASTTEGGFDPDMFLKILMVQLQNQSPYDTMDSQQIMEQQATLTQVEQSARQTGYMQEMKESIGDQLAAINQQLAAISQKL